MDEWTFFMAGCRAGKTCLLRPDSRMYKATVVMGLFACFGALCIFIFILFLVFHCSFAIQLSMTYILEIPLGTEAWSSVGFWGELAETYLAWLFVSGPAMPAWLAPAWVQVVPMFPCSHVMGTQQMTTEDPGESSTQRMLLLCEMGLNVCKKTNLTFLLIFLIFHFPFFCCQFP